MHDIKILLKYYRLTLLRKIQYRFVFLLSTFSSIINSLLLVAFFGYLYRNTPSIVGFTFFEVICIQGISIIILSLYRMFFGNGAPTFIQSVITGRIELYMVKPINWKILPTVKNSSIHHLFHILFGFFLVMVSLKKSNLHVTFSLFFIVIISILLSTLSIMMFQLIISAIGMKIRLYSLGWIYWDFTEFSSYPYKIVPKALFYLLSIIPALGISAFPEGILFQRWSYEILVIQTVIVLFLYLVQKTLWIRMEMLYEGSGTIR